MSYTPRGAMVVWLNAMRAEPDRKWTTIEAAAVMGIPYRSVGSYAAYAVSAGVMHRGGSRRRVLYSLQPFPEGERYGPETVKKAQPKQWSPKDDYRVARVVPGWKPPQMVCVRLGG